MSPLDGCRNTDADTHTPTHTHRRAREHARTHTHTRARHAARTGRGDRATGWRKPASTRRRGGDGEVQPARVSGDVLKAWPGRRGEVAGSGVAACGGAAAIAGAVPRWVSALCWDPSSAAASRKPVIATESQLMRSEIIIDNQPRERETQVHHEKWSGGVCEDG